MREARPLPARTDTAGLFSASVVPDAAAVVFGGSSIAYNEGEGVSNSP